MAPGDKLAVRVITMGQIRDRIRFFNLVGNMVKADQNSIERGFYYLGYEVETPEALLVSRQYPIEENFSWMLSSTLRDEVGAGFLKLKSSEGKNPAGKGLRGAISIPLEPLKTVDDLMEWQLPASVDSMLKLSDTSAEIKGTTRYQKVGPTSKMRSVQTEEGAGQLKVYLELW